LFTALIFGILSRVLRPSPEAFTPRRITLGEMLPHVGDGILGLRDSARRIGDAGGQSPRPVLKSPRFRAGTSSVTA